MPFILPRLSCCNCRFQFELPILVSILLLIPLLRALNLILVFAGCSRFTKLPFLFFGRECFVGPISFCSHLNLR